jgi:hypothetical protein
VWVIQRGNGTRLLEKARAIFGFECFDRNDPIQSGITACQTWPNELALPISC